MSSHQGDWPCFKCGRAFASVGLLSDHVQQRHPEAWSDSRQVKALVEGMCFGIGVPTRWARSRELAGRLRVLFKGAGYGSS